MQTLLTIAFLALLLGGCTTPKKNYFDNRRTIVGSDIPTKRNQVPDAPVSVNAPPESVGRNRPSLYPVDPVVGTGPRSN